MLQLRFKCAILSFHAGVPGFHTIYLPEYHALDYTTIPDRHIMPYHADGRRDADARDSCRAMGRCF